MELSRIVSFQIYAWLIGHAAIGPGGYYGRGGLDLRLKGLQSVTLEAWIEVGWRQHEAPIITLADRGSGSIDSLRVWRRLQGLQISFSWRNQQLGGGEVCSLLSLQIADVV